MYLVRDARGEDLDDLHAVATYLNSVNLPADKRRLGRIIDRSIDSFAARLDVPDRQYLFVLTDGDDGPVVGSSMVFAQHGSRRAPHVYFDVLEEERYSATLDLHFTHRILRIGYNYKGVTEIGGWCCGPSCGAIRVSSGACCRSSVSCTSLATARSSATRSCRS